MSLLIFILKITFGGLFALGLNLGLLWFYWEILLVDSKVSFPYITLIPGILLGLYIGIVLTKDYYSLFPDVWEKLGYSIPKTHEEKRLYKEEMKGINKKMIKNPYLYVFGISGLIMIFTPLLTLLLPITQYLENFVAGIFLTSLVVFFTSLLYFSIKGYKADKRLRTNNL